MKVWIVTICMLLVAVAAVYVVWTVALPTKLPDKYAIPEGRYDCFMAASQKFEITSGFPSQMPTTTMPLPPKADAEETVEFLGKTLTIGVYGKDAMFARMAAQQAARRVEQIAAMADRTCEASEISQINREAGDRPMRLSEDMYRLLKRAMELSQKSKGAFDVTMGPLYDLWGAYAGRGDLPPGEDILNARTLVGYSNIQIDDSKRLIRFKKKGVTLDLRDIIGGFAADQAAYVLLGQTVTSAYVRVGDCWRLLKHPKAEDGQMWMMGIPDVNVSRAGRASRVFSCDRGAVVSKGFYTGFRFVRGTPVGDIIDPRTGLCASGVGVCVVVGPDATTCDAMASTLVCLGGGADFFLRQFNPKESEPKPAKPSWEE